jgi:hypothetical protein
MGSLTDNMARLREEIEASRSARVAFAMHLKHDVAEMQASFRDARVANARIAKAERMQFINDLAAYVSDLRTSVLGMRQRFAEDLASARHVWRGRFPYREPGGKGPLAQRSIKAESDVRVMEIAEAISDDLTAIPGIGPGRLERLNRAGIRTFAQLARCRPEELRKIVGKTAKTADVQRWVTEAGELAGQY